jgi:hypothetical protein
MKEYTFTYKRAAYHTLTVKTTQDEEKAWKLAERKIQDYDWSNEEFETEVVDFRELNPNRLY